MSARVTVKPCQAHHAAMSPPMAPAPMTWTWRGDQSPSARLLSFSRRKKTRTRLREGSGARRRAEHAISAPCMSCAVPPRGSPTDISVWGGGVMRDRRLLLGFRAHAIGGELAAVRAVDELDEKAAALPLQLSGHGAGGGGLDVPLGHDRVEEAERLGAAGAHVAAGQHH